MMRRSIAVTAGATVRAAAAGATPRVAMLHTRRVVGAVGMAALRRPQLVHAVQPGMFSPVGAGAVRFLNLHEYQSKGLMEKYGVVTQRGEMAETVEQARHIAQTILKRNPHAELVVKAQVHAGGRGKGRFMKSGARGVIICKTAQEAANAASQMLNDTLVTIQTGAAGQHCKKVLINESLTIKHEYYFAILMDRAYNGPVVVVSRKGGMDIEKVAEEDPAAIVKIPIDITEGMTDAKAAKIAEAFGWHGELAAQGKHQFKSLYNLFVSTDSTQVEINPLAIGHYHGEHHEAVIVVDAKLNFDDNAAFRHEELFSLRDRSMEDPRDVAAEAAGLNYIGLDGSIGCLVNGAGLAMATCDIIQLNGASPANFLDVGGGATAEQVTKAFNILTSDKKVKAILVNIFGGIMKCDTIANGVVTAVRETKLTLPLVVRLEGTNVELGKSILDKSGFDIITASNLDDAAKKAAHAVRSL